VAKLETEDDPQEIARLQGQARQLKILAAMPEEIERLDAMIEKSEEYARIKDNNSRIQNNNNVT